MLPQNIKEEKGIQEENDTGNKLLDAALFIIMVLKQANTCADNFRLPENSRVGKNDPGLSREELFVYMKTIGTPVVGEDLDLILEYAMRYEFVQKRTVYNNRESNDIKSELYYTWITNLDGIKLGCVK
jgi:hypothetical protein